jgi:hypothetical protein
MPHLRPRRGLKSLAQHRKPTGKSSGNGSIRTMLKQERRDRNDRASLALTEQTRQSAAKWVARIVELTYSRNSTTFVKKR